MLESQPRELASSRALRTREVALGWVKQPAAVEVWDGPFLEGRGWGAESDPGGR